MPIYQSLTYIKSKVEEALGSVNGPPVEVFLDSIAKDDVKQGVYVSLLYEEEEKTLKNNDYLQKYYEPTNPNQIKGYRKVNPAIFLNLYVLILSTHSPYDEGLKQISSIISCFRHKNVFNKQRNENGKIVDDFGENYPGLDKLVLDLHTLTFEQNNSLWQTLGSKLYPYVVYKVTMVAYAEGMKAPDMEPVKKVIEVVTPIVGKGVSEGSDPAITDMAVIAEEKELIEQVTIDTLKLIDAAEVVDNGESDEENKKKNSVIIVNSKEVYDAVMAELQKRVKVENNT